MAGNRIVLQVDFQSQNANQNIDTINKNIAKIGTTAEKSSKQAATGLKGFTLAVDQSSRSLESLQGAVAGLAIFKLTASMFESADAINRVEISLRTMTHSSSVARDTIAQIRALAKTEPFSFPELAETAQRLAGFGFQAARIPGILQTISDAAAALGKGKVGIDSITLALAQIRTKGIAQGQELFRQLAEQGVDVGKYLKPAIEQELGKAIDETTFRQLVEKGRIEGKKAANLILEGLKRDFGGQGAAQINLGTVQIQKLQDSLVDLSRSFAEVVAPTLSKVVKLFQDFLTIVQTIPPDIKKLIVEVLALAAAMKLLTAVFGLEFTGLATGAVKAVKAISFAFGELTTAIKLAVEAGSIKAFFSLFSVEAAAALPLLARFSGYILLIGTALAGYELGSRLSKLLDPFGWEKQNEDLEKLKKNSQEFAAFQAQQLRARAAAYDPKYAQPPSRPYATQTVEELQEENRNLLDFIRGARQAASENAGKLVIESQELLKHQTEIATQALERSLGHLEGGVGRVKQQFKALLREVKGDSEQAKVNTATVQTAQETELAHLHNEFMKQITKDTNALAREQTEFAIHSAQKVADFQKAKLEGFQEETLEQTRSIETQRLRIELATAAEINDRRNDLARRENEDLVEIQHQRLLLGAITEDQFNAYKKSQDDIYLARKKNIEVESANDIARLRLEAEQKLNQALLRQQEQLARDRLHVLDLEYSLRQAQVEAGNARTVDQQIELEKQILKVQIERINATRKIQELALDDEEAFYVGLAYKQIRDSKEREAYLLDLHKYYTKKKAEVTADADTQIAIDTIQTTKRTNDIIYDEQKRVYDKIHDNVGRVLDALFHKATSVWAAIGNALKEAILNAIKQILAAEITRKLFELFGYGSVSRGGPGQGPVFGAPGTTGGTSGYQAPRSWRDLLRTVFGGGAAAAVSARTPDYNPSRDTPQVETRGESHRYMDEGDAGPDTAAAPARAPAVQQAVGLARSLGLGGGLNLAKARDLFNIGKNIKLSNGTSVSWGNATPVQKLGAVLSSPGFHALAATIGVGAALAGLQRGGVVGNIQTVAGGALIGFGLAQTLHMSSTGGALLGAGAGLFAAGLQRGGVSGLAMTTIGGAVAGFEIGGKFGAGPLGALIGAAAGAIAGGVRLLIPGRDQKLRERLKNMYGIDIADAKIRKQIMEISDQKFGGNDELGIRSPEVQEIVRLYALATGQQPRLPRPMYGATFEQSGAGGLQLQPVYSGGQLVPNPYSGTTTSQWSHAGLYVQLDPITANALFRGQVVNVLQNSPATVSSAAATGVASGNGRSDLRTALMEPATVTR